jgi:hypothetical protein
MRSKLALLCFGLVVVASACNQADDDGGDATSTRRPAASQPAPGGTPDVTRAPEGKINRPRAGTYVYAYETAVTRPGASPSVAPQTSEPAAELESTVEFEGDVSSTADRSTEGSAVSTLRQRWEDDRVVDLSTELESDAGTSGCEYAMPLESIRIPIEAGALPTQTIGGEGTACSGQRTVTVEERETVADENGVRWSTWRIRVETRTPGTTTTKTDTHWFSPDLGKDVRVRGVTELSNAQGQVQTRAEQTSVLKSYPGA